MTSLNYCIQNCQLFRPNFLHTFRNVKKLKNSFFQPIYGVVNVFHLSNTNQTNIKYPLISAMITRNCSISANINFRSIRFMSRWTKCSHGGIFECQSSRKKSRSGSIQFAANVRAKIQSAKRETRKRMHKKMSKIKENILTIPNGLCVLRIISTPVLGYLVLSEFYTTSLGLFLFAGFTDLIDGYIARNFPNQESMIGSFLDPAADKLLISTLVITLTINGLIPVLLTSLIIFRDACLMGAGFYIRYVSLPPPKTLTRYFDMSFVTARLSPTAISKANTAVQLSLVAVSLAAPVFSYVDHTSLHILWYITGTTTVLSAASYLYYKNTYMLFRRDVEEKEK